MNARFRIILIGATLLIAFVVVAAAIKRDYTFRLTPAIVETYLRSKFPYEKRELIFTARFTDPSFAIDPATDQATLTVSATSSAVGYETASSQVEAKGMVRYEPDSREIYLDSPTIKIQKLEIAGLSERNEDRAEATIQRALQYYLERRPLYRLQTKGPLKSMRMHDGAIEIEIGY